MSLIMFHVFSIHSQNRQYIYFLKCHKLELINLTTTNFHNISDLKTNEKYVFNK